MKSIDIVSCRLVKDKKLNNGYVIKNPFDAIRLIVENFNDLEKEYLFVINCDTKMKPTNVNIVSIGTENETGFNAKTLYRSAILSNARNVIILHNHPSDVLEPSHNDLLIFENMKEAGRLLDITLVDSLIFNYDKEIYSIKGKKCCMLDESKYSNNFNIELETSLSDFSFVDNDEGEEDSL